MALLPRVLVTSAVVALMAAPSVATALDPGTARCVEELARARLVGSDVNPSTANFILGTDGNDIFLQTDTRFTSGVDVVCGFDGDDQMQSRLDANDVFLMGLGNDGASGPHGTVDGGAGNDGVQFLSGGTFNGGAGDDKVAIMSDGTFNGGAGDDHVSDMDGGTFNGGDGNDSVNKIHIGGTFSGGAGDGTFNGGAGDDSVSSMDAGTFNGGDGNDSVTFLHGGTFNGGDGNDSVTTIKSGGTCSEVESGC